MSIYTYKTSGDGSWVFDTSTVTFNGSGFSGQVSMNTKQFCEQPDSICKNSFTWSWRVLYVDEELLGPPYEIGTSSHTYYKVLATPQAPMNYSWVEVLDYSCEWAQGEDTVVDAATDVATGIYNMQDYSGNIEFLKITDYTDEYGFHLSTFLSHLQTENVFVNCYDCSNLFCIFSNALGCSTQTKLGLGDIYTYPIYLIGNNTPPLSEEFGSHQFGWISDFFVYDSCLTIYPDILPYNMYYITYDSALIQTGSLSYQNPETTVIAN